MNSRKKSAKVIPPDPETQRRVVEAARSWEGTPFGHQQRSKGPHGVVDCAGFMAGVGEESGTVDDVDFEQNYRREENGEAMLALLDKYMLFVGGRNKKSGEYEGGAIAVADVLALVDEKCQDMSTPRHLVIVTELEPYPKIIHASQHGVKEHRMNNHFFQRLHSVWRLPPPKKFKKRAARPESLRRAGFQIGRRVAGKVRAIK